MSEFTQDTTYSQHTNAGTQDTVPKRIQNITDPCELIVAMALASKGVPFVHETENKSQRFDFYLPEQRLFVEVKQFSTPRTANQIEGREDVIVIQGRPAASAFAALLEACR